MDDLGKVVLTNVGVKDENEVVMNGDAVETVGDLDPVVSRNYKSLKSVSEMIDRDSSNNENNDCGQRHLYSSFVVNQINTDGSNLTDKVSHDYVENDDTIDAKIRFSKDSKVSLIKSNIPCNAKYYVRKTSSKTRSIRNTRANSVTHEKQIVKEVETKKRIKSVPKQSEKVLISEETKVKSLDLAILNPNNSKFNGDYTNLEVTDSLVKLKAENVFKFMMEGLGQKDLEKSTKSNRKAKRGRKPRL